MDDEFKKKLLALYPEYDRVTGPYLRKDGRKHVCFNNSNLITNDPKKKRTVSWPKALVEVRDNRRLLDNETVDHNDRNVANDNLNNLIIRDRVEHIKLDALRIGFVEIVCIWCKTKFLYKNKNKHKEKSGPFCSRKCTGEYGSNIQNGGEKLDRNEPKKIYFVLDKKAV
jgi:hypothetical protein